MLSKYIWFFFFVSVIYTLYSRNYYQHIQSYVKNYYERNLKDFYGTAENIVLGEKGEMLFTAGALRKYSNLDDGLYLSILGQVFDVTQGEKHYGPGQPYHAFTGCDASAAFITGDFDESGLTDDVSSLTNKQIQSLMTWVEFYRKTYPYMGKLIGRYYNKDGSPTNERYVLEEKVQISIKSDSLEEKRKLQFPPCNIEWDADIGTRVWCSKNSGGITRNWIGVPRRIYDSPGSEHYTCACVRLDGKDFEENKGIIREFEGCTETSTTCILPTIDT